MWSCFQFRLWQKGVGSGVGEETVLPHDSGIFPFADSCTVGDSGWQLVVEEEALLTYKRLTVTRSLHGTITHMPRAHQHDQAIPATVLMTSKLI